MSTESIFKIPAAPDDPSYSEDISNLGLTKIESSLFEVASELVRHIEDKIRSKEEIPKIKRKLVRSHISGKLGLNPSFITARRHQRLSEFIDSENRRLELMYQSVQRDKADRVHKKSLTQMTKAELITEVRRLKREILDSDHEVVLAQIDRIIESELSVGQRRTSMIVESLKLENDRNARELAQLIDTRQALEEELSDEISKRRSLEKQLQSLRE